MLRAVIFDTETTGKLESQPHLVQVAAKVMIMFPASKWITVSSASFLVQCPIPVPKSAERVHGIMQEMTQHGITPEVACKWLSGLVSKADLVVAHNLRFDIPVMNLHYQRAKLPEPSWGTAQDKTYCTMEGATDVCAIPHGSGGFKWPSLSEALRQLCKHELQTAHDAMADVDGCLRLLKELCFRKQVPQFNKLTLPKKVERIENAEPVSPNTGGDGGPGTAGAEGAVGGLRPEQGGLRAPAKGLAPPPARDWDSPG